MLLLRVCLTTCLAASLWYFYSAYFLTSIVETRFHDISLNSYTKKKHHIMSFLTASKLARSGPTSDKIGVVNLIYI